MPLLQDVDALLLLALAISSKRRPAELEEIMAATDLIQGVVPADVRLVDSFARLADHGLICAEGNGFLLTPAAQKIMAGQSRKAEAAQRLQSIKDRFAAYEPAGEPIAERQPIRLTVKQVCTAILAYRESVKSTAKNLLPPKPKEAEGDNSRPGQHRRKPLPARRRKD
jgi:hypothetical protein